MSNKSMPYIVLIVVGTLILAWAPWMTEPWCMQRLNASGIYGKGSHPYQVTWIPFGRSVFVSSLTDEEYQQYVENYVIGGYGVEYHISLFGEVTFFRGM